MLGPGGIGSRKRNRLIVAPIANCAEVENVVARRSGVRLRGAARVYGRLGRDRALGRLRCAVGSGDVEAQFGAVQCDCNTEAGTVVGRDLDMGSVAVGGRLQAGGLKTRVERK